MPVPAIPFLGLASLMWAIILAFLIVYARFAQASPIPADAFPMHKYKKKRLLGSGGFGSVHLLEKKEEHRDNDDELPPFVAMKVISTDENAHPSMRKYRNREIAILKVGEKNSCLQKKDEGFQDKSLATCSILSKYLKETTADLECSLLIKTMV